MSSQAWTPAEETLLLTLVQQGKTAFEIWQLFQAQGIGRTQKAVTRKIQDSKLADPQTWRPQLVRSEMPRFNEPMQVTGNALIWADVHAPCHDAGWMDRTANLAIKWGIRNLIIAGDFADFNSFSVFGREAGIDANQELETLSKLMDALSKTFCVWYFAGNHDVRPIKALKNNDAGLDLSWIIRMFTPKDGELHVSNYYWCELVSANECYQIEHPKNTSVHATIVPKKLAEKYGRHVVGAHGHAWGQSIDISGRYWAIDSGVCADPLRMGYIQQRHSTRPEVVQGAVVIMDGVPILLGKDNISFYERMHP
jgi:hypothetical protein